MQEHIKKYIDVKKSGHNAIAKCPFHTDSSPSLYIYPNNYHCFACKAHGNVIDFEMHQKNLTFREAIFELGSLYQIEIALEDEVKKNAKQKNDEVVSLKIEEFHKDLKKRLFELSESALKTFLIHHVSEIGYLDKPDLLKNFARDLNLSLSLELLEGGNFYVLPFQTERGKILGFLFLKLEMELSLNVPYAQHEFKLFLSDETYYHPLINFPQARKNIVHKRLIVATNVFDFFFLLKHGVSNSAFIPINYVSGKTYQFFSKFVTNVFLIVSEEIKDIPSADQSVFVLIRWVKKDFSEKVKFYQSLDEKTVEDWVFGANKIKPKSTLNTENEVKGIKEKKTQKKYEIGFLEKTSSFYHRILLHPSSQHVVEYLEKRGFGLDDIKEWNLGFCPRDSILTRALLKDNTDIQIFLDLGILRVSQKKMQYYDFFYDRFVIPILNHFGECVALGGRILDDTQKVPKYINSSESTLFSKSKILFNYYSATNHIVENGYVIVVEGYMDCMTLVKHGVRNVVAVMGTALTYDHLCSLSQITQRIILCFDSDSAGQQAIKKSFLSNLKFPSLILEVIELPSAKDPDEFVKNHGIAAFLNIIKNQTIIVYEYVTQMIQSYSRDMEEFVLNLTEEFRSYELFAQSKLGQNFSNYLLETYHIQSKKIFNKNVHHAADGQEISLISQESSYVPTWSAKSVLEIKIIFTFFYCALRDLPKKMFAILIMRMESIEEEDYKSDNYLFHRAYERQISEDGKKILQELFCECQKKHYASCTQLLEKEIENFSALTKILAAYIKKHSSILVKSGVDFLIEHPGMPPQQKRGVFDCNQVFSAKNAQFLRFQLKNIELIGQCNELVKMLVELLLQLELSEIDFQLEQYSKTHFNQHIDTKVAGLIQEREIRRVLLVG